MLKKKGLIKFVLGLWLMGLFLTPLISNAAADYTIAITEVLSNCSVGQEGYNEFIELHNYGADSVDVNNFTFTDGDTLDYITLWNEATMGIIPDPDIITGTTIIPSGSFAVIIDPNYLDGDQPYDFPLGTIIVTVRNNDIGSGLAATDPITLYEGPNSIQDEVIDTFGTPVQNDAWSLCDDDGLDAIPFDPGQEKSLERTFYDQPDDETNWSVCADIPSPGGDNNDVPIAVITADPISGEAPLPVHFSAVDSTDPEAQPLTFNWEFPDETTAETEDVDYIFTETGNQLVILTVSDGDLEDTAEITIEVNQIPGFTVRLNEILPDPEGADADGEFIELYNYGDQIVDLSGYKLDDQEGGSSSYVFPEETTVNADEYFVVERSESGLALNNDQDSARLLDSTDAILEDIPYQNGDEGWSYSYHNDEWDWTNIVTPGEENQISGDVLGDQDEYQSVNISQAKSLEDGTKVSFEGVVTVEPGVFSEKYFYVQTGKDGLQVYFSQSDFPALKLGDKLKVRGKMSTASSERKVNLSEKSDIQIIGQGEVKPEEIKTGESKDDKHTGQLIIVQGEVSRSSGKTFYLDDNSGESKISIKDSTGINKPETKKGTKLRITGVVNKTSSGNRLLPRYQSDLTDKLVSAGMNARIYLVIGLWLFVILNCLMFVFVSRD